MTNTVSDVMLMAYVDGELDETAATAVNRTMAQDPALARRAESFRISRDRAREAIAAIRAEPLPDRLIATVFGSANENVASPRRGWTARAVLPLAASVALIAGLAGYWIGLPFVPDNGGLLGGRFIAEALRKTPAGAERTIPTAAGDVRFRVLGSYRVANGMCRTYALSGRLSGHVRGVGCNRGHGWSVEVAVATGDDGMITPATSAAPAVLEAFLEALDAEGPLGAEEEAAVFPNK